LLAPIAVAAYSYMSLIPIIQPPIMRLMTTKRERMVRMEYAPRPISRGALIAFPIVVTLVVGIIVPDAVPLISMLMLGNLLRESGVVDRLNKTAQNELINIATLFLGLAIGATMEAGGFLSTATLKIMGLGLIAFTSVVSTGEPSIQVDLAARMIGLAVVGCIGCLGAVGLTAIGHLMDRH
jgi:oxaloacetate decarboxylase beta subunit